MTKRMLIDATHAEETRVVVLDGTQLEDFDVETAAKRHLKGNIYLAKVVRVEPSLQAAFVEFGGNRHGFLAFSEIHPDYYQIPVADRQRLLEMVAEDVRRDEEDDVADMAFERPRHRTPSHPAPGSHGPDDDHDASVDDDVRVAGWARPHFPLLASMDPASLSIPDNDAPMMGGAPGQSVPWPYSDRPKLLMSDPATNTTGDRRGSGMRDVGDDAWAVPTEPRLLAHIATSEASDESGDQPATYDFDARTDDGADFDEGGQSPLETLGGDTDNADERDERRHPPRFMRNYKIQEVIRRRQIMLVQVVKEERGTKGAALTTYLSLAGRFSVLMPNSPRGGGISRKITSAADRRRLKEVMSELDMPRGMGLIIRTAGAARPKPEIKRDCEYLLRLWDDIRDHTFKSSAPSLIYEEASLIKRSIRDVYSRDVDEILVDGNDGWRSAHDFMAMLMPTHTRKVQQWSDRGQPLFAHYQVEPQLDAMLQPLVQLRSGGYLVINQTEALVAVDVNSGRSTRERNIEETALRTNLEAADEVARQLRLRDLAGLIVIDFIDMESRRHNAMVEKRLKDALRNDRARIQIGHISHFGLLEMSRQRLRPSLTETAFIMCPHCAGSGHVRTTENAAIHVLRAVQDEASRRRSAELVVYTPASIALYLLNHKRDRLQEIEGRYDVRIMAMADDTQLTPCFRIERTRMVAMDEPPHRVTPDATSGPVRPVDPVAGRTRQEADTGRAVGPLVVDDDDESDAGAASKVAEPRQQTQRETTPQPGKEGRHRSVEKSRSPTPIGHEQEMPSQAPSDVAEKLEAGPVDEGRGRRRGRRGGGRGRRRDEAGVPGDQTPVVPIVSGGAPQEESQTPVFAASGDIDNEQHGLPSPADVRLELGVQSQWTHAKFPIVRRMPNRRRTPQAWVSATLPLLMSPAGRVRLTEGATLAPGHMIGASPIAKPETSMADPVEDLPIVTKPIVIDATAETTTVRRAGWWRRRGGGATVTEESSGQQLQISDPPDVSSHPRPR